MIEWQIFYANDPWGPERSDLNAAIIAAMVANVNRDPRKDPIKPADLMPQYGPPEEMPPPEQMKERLLSGFGDRIKKQKRKAPNGS